MTMPESVDPDFIETSIDIRRPYDGGVDVLRQLVAAVELSTESGPEEIGTVSGWVGWQIGDHGGVSDGLLPNGQGQHGHRPLLGVR